MATARPAPSDGTTGRARGYVNWERRFDSIERWVPYPTLALSSAVALLQPELTGMDRLRLAVLIGVVAAWIAVLHTIPPRDRSRRPAHALIYMIGLLIGVWALLTQHPAFFIFAITGLLHSAHLRPRWLVFVGVGTTSFLILSMTWDGFPHLGAEGWVGFLVLLILQTVLIGYGVVGGERLNELAEERRRTVAQLESLLAENEGLHAQLLAQAHEAGIQDERRRMAREIHDTVAQGLAGIVTQLEAADQRRGDVEAARHHLDAAAALARESLVEARRSVQALTPGLLEHGRLAGALETVARDWSERTGVPAEMAVHGVPTSLPTRVEVALLRVGQESLTNVAKHAAAGMVGLSLGCEGGDIVLQVTDDGGGFDPAKVNGEGFGLRTMRERIEDVAGMLTIDTRPGRGTTVVAQVPIDQEAQG